MNRVIQIIRWVFVHPLLSLAALIATIVLITIVASLFSGDSQGPEPGKNAVTGTTGPTNQKSGSDTQANRPIAQPPISPKKEKPRTSGIEEGDIDPERVKPKPDPFDGDTAESAEVERQLNEQPAVQSLPLNRSGVFADISNVLPDGRLVITASYSGRRKQAEAVWSAFLKKNGDSGKSYVVIFKPR